MLVLGAVLVAAGVIWNGVAHGGHAAAVASICSSGPGGPMSFRFVLQPVMAAIAALHDGITDARAHRSPYLWSMIHEPAKPWRCG